VRHALGWRSAVGARRSSSMGASGVSWGLRRPRTRRCRSRPKSAWRSSPSSWRRDRERREPRGPHAACG
jgi:hypothetical protein